MKKIENNPIWVGNGILNQIKEIENFTYKIVIMNKKEMKTIAISKVQDRLNAIINDINDNIIKCAEKGLFIYTFDTTKFGIGYDIINIILEDFSSRGFSIEKHIKGNPIISIGWFRK